MSCETADVPPFDLTVTVLPIGNAVRIDWPLVNDPRIGTVRYDLYLGTNLIASNLTTNTYTINNLAFNTTYTGRLVGKNSANEQRSVSFTFTTSKEYLLIPDPGLEQALIEAGYDTEGTINGKIIKDDAPAVKVLNAKAKNISNTEGIQHFINLEEIDLSENQINQVNFGQNLKLFKINVGSNNLTNINLSPNTSLKFLYVFNNKLNQLNITQNTLLEVLVADRNLLSAIDLSRCTLLVTLGLGTNRLTNISLSSNTKLESLIISENPINFLNISSNNLLTYLACNKCNLNTLSVQNLNNLSHLYVSGNNLTSINLALNSQLKILDVSFNRLNALSLKNNPNLLGLNTENNNNLSQICVLNVLTAQNNLDWTTDSHTVFSSNCN